jgi:hypothetical protein
MARLGPSSILVRSNIGRVAFDARTSTVKGPVDAVTTGTNDFAYIDVTRDGRVVVGATSGRGREDLYVVPGSGGTLRALTNDFARDRFPR